MRAHAWSCHLAAAKQRIGEIFSGWTGWTRPGSTLREEKFRWGGAPPNPNYPGGAAGRQLDVAWPGMIRILIYNSKRLADRPEAVRGLASPLPVSQDCQDACIQASHRCHHSKLNPHVLQVTHHHALLSLIQGYIIPAVTCYIKYYPHRTQTPDPITIAALHQYFT